MKISEILEKSNESFDVILKVTPYTGFNLRSDRRNLPIIHCDNQLNIYKVYGLIENILGVYYPIDYRIELQNKYPDIFYIKRDNPPKIKSANPNNYHRYIPLLIQHIDSENIFINYLDDNLEITRPKKKIHYQWLRQKSNSEFDTKDGIFKGSLENLPVYKFRPSQIEKSYLDGYIYIKLRVSKKVLNLLREKLKNYKSYFIGESRGLVDVELIEDKKLIDKISSKLNKLQIKKKETKEGYINLFNFENNISNIFEKNSLALLISLFKNNKDSCYSLKDRICLVSIKEFKSKVFELLWDKPLFYEENKIKQGRKSSKVYRNFSVKNWNGKKPKNVNEYPWVLSEEVKFKSSFTSIQKIKNINTEIENIKIESDLFKKIEDSADYTIYNHGKNIYNSAIESSFINILLSIITSISKYKYSYVNNDYEKCAIIPDLTLDNMILYMDMFIKYDNRQNVLIENLKYSNFENNFRIPEFNYLNLIYHITKIEEKSKISEELINELINNQYYYINISKKPSIFLIRKLEIERKYRDNIKRIVEDRNYLKILNNTFYMLNKKTKELKTRYSLIIERLKNFIFFPTFRNFENFALSKHYSYDIGLIDLLLTLNNFNMTTDLINAARLLAKQLRQFVRIKANIKGKDIKDVGKDEYFKFTEQQINNIENKLKYAKNIFDFLKKLSEIKNYYDYKTTEFNDLIPELQNIDTFKIFKIMVIACIKEKSKSSDPSNIETSEEFEGLDTSEDFETSDDSEISEDSKPKKLGKKKLMDIKL